MFYTTEDLVVTELIVQYALMYLHTHTPLKTWWWQSWLFSMHWCIYTHTPLTYENYTNIGRPSKSNVNIVLYMKHA